MARIPSRRGFTLVELLLTTTIFTFVAVSLFSAYVGGSRLLRQSFAEAELSVRTRELRDKLLFHAAPAHDSVVWAGLLSGTNTHAAVEGNGTRIRLNCTALKGASRPEGTANQSIQLVFRNANTTSCSLFSEDRIDENWPTRWLHPANLDFFAGNPNPAAILVADTLDNGRFYINVTARSSSGGIPCVHNERIVVPVFGRTQRTEVNAGGLCR